MIRILIEKKYPGWHEVITFQVKIKMITYDGTKWLSTTVFAESMSECMNKIEQEYKLYDCLNYWVNVKELAAG